jgi:WD40 repeat protein
MRAPSSGRRLGGGHDTVAPRPIARPLLSRGVLGDELVGVPVFVPAAGGDQTIRIWDPATGQLVHTLEGHTGGVNALKAFTADQRTLLASTNTDDETIRIWDPTTEQLLHTLEGHTGGVNVLEAFSTTDRRTLLASTSKFGDRMVWIWELFKCQAQMLEIRTHHEAKAIAYTDGLLVIGLTAGLLVIQLSDTDISV